MKKERNIEFSSQLVYRNNYIITTICVSLYLDSITS